MYRSIARMFVPVLAAISICIPVAGNAADKIQFSATMVQHLPRNETMETRIFVGANAMRSEMDSPNGKRVTIVDMRKGTAWMLNPDRREYVEMLNDSQGQIPSRTPLPDDPQHPCTQQAPQLECKKLGTEMINGRQADKWEMTFTMDQRSERVVAWIDNRLRTPLREEMPGGVVRELRDVQEGPLPASLFSVPPGYKRIELPGKQEQPES